jgi:hypothetical protein
LLLVVAAGFEIRPLVQGETLPTRYRRGRFYYEWSADPRIEGAGVYLRFAAMLLGRVTHNIADEFLLAGELAVPDICTRAFQIPEIVERHRHAPISWIEAKARARAIERGSGVFYRPPELAS